MLSASSLVNCDMSRPKSPYYDLMFRQVDGKTLATKEYSTFMGMKSRIKSKTNYSHLQYDPSFDGPNGFKNFLDEVGFAPTPNHTLERSENSLGYLIGNIVWATYSENLRNRSVTLWVTDTKDKWPMLTYCEQINRNPLPLKQYMHYHKLKVITVEELIIHGYA